MRASFCFGVLFLLAVTNGDAQPKRFAFSAIKMAAPFRLIFYTSDSSYARSLANDCFRLTDSLVNIFSDYIDSSELNRLCARAGTGVPMVCSEALFDILWQSRQAWRESRGLFDITLGPLTRLWRDARRSNRFPDSMLVKEKLSLTGCARLQLDSSNHSALLIKRGMQLDLGGIAQGYIGQKVLDYLRRRGVVTALVDVSGDIVCIGRPPGSSGWKIAINLPEDTVRLMPRALMLDHGAVTTSGDVYQFMEYNGHRYSHIIDPRTGYGITTPKNVTVIAGDGVVADWLTKACSILSPEEAIALARRLGAEVIVAERVRGKLVLRYSAGIKEWLTR